LYFAILHINRSGDKDGLELRECDCADIGALKRTSGGARTHAGDIGAGEL